ncbi:hypothetical protein Bhyg_11397 [Pseudolycoriella hygida]|uniref:Uncharacterized protein n=1 Tax=Pseudolycoriella hygida TaxID=35572 RepID=A0A9Q0MX30_9DIPT|nr:hypothetical protein Bhyg_11397 [Pseudolycoriella hygida]
MIIQSHSNALLTASSLTLTPTLVYKSSKNIYVKMFFESSTGLPYAIKPSVFHASLVIFSDYNQIDLLYRLVPIEGHESNIESSIYLKNEASRVVERKAAIGDISTKFKFIVLLYWLREEEEKTIISTRSLHLIKYKAIFGLSIDTLHFERYLADSHGGKRFIVSTLDRRRIIFLPNVFLKCDVNKALDGARKDNLLGRWSLTTKRKQPKQKTSEEKSYPHRSSCKEILSRNSSCVAKKTLNSDQEKPPLAPPQVAVFAGREFVCSSSFQSSAGIKAKNKSTTTFHSSLREIRPRKRWTSRANIHHIKPMEWVDFVLHGIAMSMYFNGLSVLQKAMTGMFTYDASMIG